MGKLKLLFVTVLFLSFLGCENKAVEHPSFDFIKSSDGKIYRLNQQNGKIDLIDKDKIIPLSSIRSDAAKDVSLEKEIPESQNAAENKEILKHKEKEVADEKSANELTWLWNEEEFNGKNLKAKLKISSAGDKIEYIFDVYPYETLRKIIRKKENDVFYQRKWHGFRIEITDSSGVFLAKININLWTMQKVFDTQGKLSGLKERGEIKEFNAKFSQISNCLIKWNLDTILMPDYKFENKIEDLIQTYNSYGEVDRRIDKDAPAGAKYWWMTFPDKKKVYFSTEDELLSSYKITVEEIIKKNR